MFYVEGFAITLSRGDTGALRLKAKAKRKDTGADYTFGERDRALFTIKGGNKIVKQKSYPIVNNMFKVVFMNADTQDYAAGGYNWDVRYVINPYYDTEIPGGPWTPYDELEFPVAAGTPCEHNYGLYYAAQDIATQEAWTAAHWTGAWPAYDDLTFPVSRGDKCMHGGTYYIAADDIETSEEWTPEHWIFADDRIPVDGDQVITPKTPMGATLLSVVGEI